MAAAVQFSPLLDDFLVACCVLIQLVHAASGSVD
jgi:hypothetical protein